MPDKRRKPSRRNFLIAHFEQLEARRLLAADLAIPERVPGEILVQYVRDVPPAQLSAIRASVGAELNSGTYTPAMQAAGVGKLELLTIDRSRDVDQTVQYLLRNPFISFAEPNYVYQRNAISNDSHYLNGSLWGLFGDDLPTSVGPTGTTNPFAIQAEKVWAEDLIGSSGVVVGILDEGIDVNHPDLANNIWVNPYEIADDGIDNDGNGYIDDIHGWDFVSDDNSVYDAGQDWHGTHVAGTIGGEGGNGTGVVGVNWDVSMISLKFLSPSGGTTYDAIRALDYLTDLKARHGINIVASNNSWSGGGYSQALHEAILRSAKRDILFVTAAGNEAGNNDLSPTYPAHYNTTQGTWQETAAGYDAVIAVASITKTGGLSSFSNYGATSVDIGAPGSGIWSTVPSGGYGPSDGTSMATPHVTGAAALFASAQGSRVSAAAIKSALLQSATPTSSLAGKTATGGRLNVYEAIRRSSFLSLDREVYGVPGTIRVTVNSNDANLNSAAVETISVSIRSTTENVAENFVLTETAANSGRFIGTISLVSGGAVTDGRLQAVHNDEITAHYSGLNLSAKARVDGLGPVVSGLTADPKATTCRISWRTDEPATTEVLYGTSATNLDRSLSGSSAVFDHKATLTGLSPATTYYFQARSRDAAGNLVASPIERFTTSTPAPILFVDDDQGAAYEAYFIAALKANDFQFDTWDAAVEGRTPSSTDLRGYQTVIWTTGTNYSSPTAGLSPIEQAAIAGYLDNGGRIFLSGQDILYNGVAEDFRRQYLKIASFINDTITSSHIETGVQGNPLSSGLSLPIAQPADFATIYVDEVLPTSDAEGAFLHGRIGSTFVHSAVNYRGDYLAGGFGIVFTTFPFESLSTTAASPNNANEFLKRTIDYLSANADARSIQVSPPSPSAETAEGGGSISFGVVLSAAPTANVTIPVTSRDTTEGITSVASLVFTPADWNVPQTVTVLGVNDFVADGHVAYTVELAPAISDDASYHGLNPNDVQLTNRDDDLAGLKVSGVTGTNTSESGGSVSFEVSLLSEPISTVTFNLGSSDASEGLASVAQVVFTAANWNQPQTITVRGVDDSLSDGHIPYAIRFTNFTSLDPTYNGLLPAELSLTNLDNEPESVLLFADSFEGPEWGGLWVEDAQNDWFVSTQRATDGSRSAEVDGFANNATLTLNNLGSPLDISAYENVTLTFAWLIESSFDAGEYVALDISADGGLTWSLNVRRILGNQSPEGVWLAESVDLTPFTSTNLKVRFRSLVSDSAEDANVDDVRIVGRPAPPPNEPPIAADDQYQLDEDRVLSVDAAGVLANDRDPYGGLLFAALVDGPSHGTVTLEPNGAFVYTPSGNFYGQDSFTYQADDGQRVSDPATVRINVAPVNDAPTAEDHPLTLVRFNTAKSLTLLATDIDGDPLSFAIVTPPLHGTLSGTAPNLTYTPHSNFIGTDLFTFKASDGSLDSPVVSWPLNVLPNTIPTADSQSRQTAEDAPLPLELTGADADGDSLSFIIIQPPTHGTLSGIAPNLTYTPSGDFNGSDSFTFRSFDGIDVSELATVSIDVLPVNDPPLANDLNLAVNEDASLGITLTGTDVDGDWLTYVIVTPPANGSLTGTGANRTYLPSRDFNGRDSFTFRVHDGSLGSSLATVSIEVLPVNDAPVAIGRSLEVFQGNTLPIELFGSDVDGDSLSYSIVTGPSRGTISGTGAFRTYVPSASFVGTDSFTFRVNDGTLDSSLATVTIQVKAPAETILFEDSFEVSEWNGKWTEDSQNDWFRSAQRATHGSRSAEIDGSADNALLVLHNNGIPINSTSFAKVTLTYDWLIESSFDSGEYVILDVSMNGGISWIQNVRGIYGNQSPENVWISEVIDLTPYSSTNLKIRFRGKVSDTAEDANLDNVKIVGSLSAGAGSGITMGTSFGVVSSSPGQPAPTSMSVGTADNQPDRVTRGMSALALADAMASGGRGVVTDVRAMDSFFHTLGADETDEDFEWGPEDLSPELGDDELGSSL